MIDREGFLSRWSRRKLQAELPQPDAPDEATARESSSVPSSEDTAERTESAQHKSTARVEPPFDVTTLPSIESITAETDVTVFLQKGVPVHLTRAALRRAWATDPAIRDFIEIAENQQDFATGVGLQGFGPLDASPEEVETMVAKVFGRTPLSQDEAPEQSLGESHQAPNPDELAAPDVAAEKRDTVPRAEARPLRASAATSPDEEHSATDSATHDIDTPKDAVTRRPHGRALPR